MKWIVIPLIVLVMLIGCSNDSEQIFESINFEKPRALSLLQEKLKSNKLYYKLDNSTLLYRHSDRVIVSKLIWDTIYEIYPSNRYTNSDEKYLLLFKTMLIEREIVFSEILERGEAYFVWGEADNNKVQLIRDEILELQSNEDIKNIIMQHKKSKVRNTGSSLRGQESMGSDSIDFR